MCGGRGSRLRPAVGETEKPLVEIGGRPMVDRVRAALRASSVSDIYAAVSPQVPETAARLAEAADVTVVETPGEGYVDDLTAALDVVGTPAVTVSADLPFLEAAHVDRALAAADGGSVAVCVPLSVAESVGASAETTVDHEGRSVVPTGLNVVGEGADRRLVVEAEPLAVNVNRPADLRLAEKIIRESYYSVSE
ncbi:NTP transferase domain-containing protein [Halohasta salina]|uniref:NTP transferase domain-containing protein n=1 Tax=Halohasta salina TaxID=2961621 RepID=UPI0020A2541B